METIGNPEIFKYAMYKCANNLFLCDFNLQENKDFHNYNTRSKDNIHKTRPKPNWGPILTVTKSAEMIGIMSINYLARDSYVLKFKFDHLISSSKNKPVMKRLILRTSRIFVEQTLDGMILYTTSR